MVSAQRSASVPATKHLSRQSVDSATSEPSIFCGHLWKQSPGVNLFSQGYRWRYVVLLKGKMGWWASEKYALQEDAKGFVDFAVDACDVFPDDKASATTFCVKPRTRRWSSGQVFTGANEGRTFVFSTEGSEHGRKAWIAAVNAHIEFGVRKRRQSVARLSLVQLSHSGVSASELQEAIREGRAAGVESSALERASVVLNRVVNHEKNMNELFNGKSAKSLSKSEKASDRPSLFETENEVSTPVSHPVVKEEQLTSKKEAEKSRPSMSVRGHALNEGASVFKPGQRIRMSGLKTFAQLNGTEGELVDWDAGERRWKVKTPEGKGFLIRTANLEELVESTDPPGTSTCTSALFHKEDEKEEAQQKEEAQPKEEAEPKEDAQQKASKEDQEEGEGLPKQTGKEDEEEGEWWEDNGKDETQEAASEKLNKGTGGEGLQSTAGQREERSMSGQSFYKAFSGVPDAASHDASAANPSGVPEQQIAAREALESEKALSVEASPAEAEPVYLPASPVSATPLAASSEVASLPLSGVEDMPSQNEPYRRTFGEVDRFWRSKEAASAPVVPPGMPKDLAEMYLENMRMGLSVSSFGQYQSPGSPYSGRHGSPAKPYGNFNPADRTERAMGPLSAGNDGEDSDDSPTMQGGGSFWKEKRLQQRSLPPPRRRHTETAPEQGGPFWMELRAKMEKRRASVAELE